MQGKNNFAVCCKKYALIQGVNSGKQAVCALCEASRSQLKNDMEVITTAIYSMKDYEIEMLAKSFLPEIRAFFESEEGRAEYEKQVAEQKIKNITQTA